MTPAWKAPLTDHWAVYWSMADGTTGAAMVATEVMADDLVAALNGREAASR